MTGAVFLSGGGGAEDSVPLDTAFASAVGSGPLWYWPIALEPVRHPSCLDWLAGVFGPLGVTEIDMWDGGESDGADSGLAQRLRDYRGVYIGGGNTYRLLDIVRRHGLLPSLRSFIDSGGVAYGGSGPPEEEIRRRPARTGRGRHSRRPPYRSRLRGGTGHQQRDVRSA